MKLIIIGPPRTKKTHQRIFRNKRTGAPMVMPAKTSKAWEASAILQLMQARAFDFESDGPVSVCALVYRDARRGDLVGYLQAIGDALERSGVIVNDRLIASWDGSRLLVDRERPRVEIEVVAFGG